MPHQDNGNSYVLYYFTTTLSPDKPAVCVYFMQMLLADTLYGVQRKSP